MPLVRVYFELIVVHTLVWQSSRQSQLERTYPIAVVERRTKCQVSMMPGGSSATPGDTPKTEPPTSLLGATGRAGSAALDVSSEVKGETPLTTRSAVSVAEGARRREQYCVLVRVVTERDQKPLQAYAWNEGLLNDFFKATIGLPHSVIITSPTECVIFAPGRLNGLGMSFDDSIKYCHILSGVHKWVGLAVQVTALQRTVKEGRHDISRARNSPMRELRADWPNCTPPYRRRRRHRWWARCGIPSPLLWNHPMDVV